MFFLKCIWGAILGGFSGVVAYVVVGLALWIVVGLVMWDSNKGEAVANFAALLIPIGILIGIIIPIREEMRRNEQEEEKRRLEAKRKQDALDNECKSLAVLLDTSKSTFLSLRQLVPAASAHLNKAEKEFEEGAFAPFWDEVENATNRLAAYHQGVNEVEHNANAYADRSSILSVSIPKFDMPKGELPDARPVAVRLSKVVRQAQKDFQFATIYEQRKTNQLLYAGFGTLASAIDRMQASIIDALEDLSTSLNTTLNDLVSVSNAQADILSTLTEHTSTSAEAQREFEKDSLEESEKQSQMLDNIQRGKKPFP